MPSTPTLTFLKESACLQAAGAWTASTAQKIEALIDHALENVTGLKTIVFDLSAIDELDTYGAWMIERISRRCAELDINLTPSSVPIHFKALLAAIHKTSSQPAQPSRHSNPLATALESIGRAFPGLASDVAAFAEMLGALTAALIRVILNPRRIPPDLGGSPSRPRRLAGVTHHAADQLPNRRNHRATGHIPFSQIRRGRLCRRSRRHSDVAGDRRAFDCDHVRRPLRQLLHRRARLDEDARRDRRAADDGARSGRGADAAARACAHRARCRS